MAQFATTMNTSEHLAKVLIESVLQGTVMDYRIDQSAGGYDFDLLYPDGISAILEVTTSTDKVQESTVAAITNKRKGGSFIQAKKCRKDWIVHPVSSANINKIRAQADEYLADIEADGLEKFFSPIDAVDYPSVVRISRELGIEGGSVVKWKNSVQIGIALPGSGGFVSAQNLQNAIQVEAYKADNRRKLGSVVVPERHLFVYVSPRNFLAWAAMLDGEPPADPPPLPEEITDVWAVTSSGQKDQFKVWRGAREGSWQNLGLLSLSGKL